MKTIYSAVLIIMLAAVPVNFSVAQEQGPADLSPLGFEFGSSKKDAKKVIKANGKRIIEEKKDSKKIKTVVMQGVIVELPVNTNGLDVRTGLEFFEKKLLSSSLTFRAEDSPTEEWLQEAFTEYFYDRYGEPIEVDEMMHFKTWTWDIPKVRLVLHTNTKDNIVKVDYTYEPIKKAKYEKELSERRGDKPGDPATQMFLDGDYSKPTDYDDRYQAPDYSNYRSNQ